MVIPALFKKRLDQISYPFGGSGVVQSVLTDKEINYLLSYPGFIYVVSPWSSEVDLTTRGFKPGSRYTILDSNRNKLYSRKSDNGIFGKIRQEKALLTQMTHMDHLYIEFESDSEPISGILWVSVRVRPQEKDSIVSSWNSQQKVLQNALDQHEAFLLTDSISHLDNIKIYFLSGSLSQRMSVSDIKQNPNTRVSVTNPDGVLSLYPKQSGWYVFEGYQNSDPYLLTLKNIKGPSSNRIQQRSVGTHFVQLGSSVSSSKRVSSRLLPSLSSSISSTVDTQYLHLEASLDLLSKSNLVGFCTVRTHPYVLRTSPSLLIRSGSSSSASIAISVRTTEADPYGLYADNLDPSDHSSKSSIYSDNSIWDDLATWERSLSDSDFNGVFAKPSGISSTSSVLSSADRKVQVVGGINSISDASLTVQVIEPSDREKDISGSIESTSSTGISIYAIKSFKSTVESSSDTSATNFTRNPGREISVSGDINSQSAVLGDNYVLKENQDKTARRQSGSTEPDNKSPIATIISPLEVVEVPRPEIVGLLLAFTDEQPIDTLRLRSAIEAVGVTTGNRIPLIAPTNLIDSSAVVGVWKFDVDFEVPNDTYDVVVRANSLSDVDENLNASEIYLQTVVVNLNTSSGGGNSGEGNGGVVTGGTANELAPIVEITHGTPIPNLTKKVPFSLGFKITAQEGLVSYDSAKTAFGYSLLSGGRGSLSRKSVTSEVDSQVLEGIWEVPADIFSSADNGLAEIYVKSTLRDTNDNKVGNNVVIATFEINLSGVPRLLKLNPPSLAPESDTGDVGDNTTDNFNPTFIGSGASPGAHINLYVDGIGAITTEDVISDSEGNYRLTPVSSVPAGFSRITVSQGQGEAESITSGSLGLTVNLPPVSNPDPDPVPLGPLPNNVLMQRVLPRNSSGGNLNATRVRSYDKLNKQQFAKACRAVGIGTWRWPGGDVGNFFSLVEERMIQNSTEILPGLDSYTHTVNPKLPNALAYSVYRDDMTFSNLKEVMDLVGMDNGKCNWVINVVTQKPEQVVAGLKKAVAAGLNISVIELGNELYFNQDNYKGQKDGVRFYKDPPHNTDVIGHLTNTEYAQDMRDRWIPILRNEFPGVKLYAVGEANSGYSPGQERVYNWIEALHTAGLFNKSNGSYIDGIASHPYVSMGKLDGALSDVGSITRAAQIAIRAHQELALYIQSPSFSFVPEGFDIAYTEWGVLEGSNVFNEVIVGNSWIGSLILNQIRMQMLSDPRTSQTMLHSVISSPQWAMISPENGEAIVPERRGLQPRPYESKIYPAITELIQGWALGLTAANAINRGGNFYLLVDQPAYMVSRIKNPSNDAIVIINAGNYEQLFYPPAGSNWDSTLYQATPWLSPLSPNEFPVGVKNTISDGDSITVPPFSLSLLKGSGTATLDNNVLNNEDRTPPQILLEEVTPVNGAPTQVEVDFTKLSSLSNLPSGWSTGSGRDTFVLDNTGLFIPHQPEGVKSSNSIRSPKFSLVNGRVIEFDFIGPDPEQGDNIGAYVGLNSIGFGKIPNGVQWLSKGTLWFSHLAEHPKQKNEKITTGVAGAKLQFRIIVSGPEIILEFRRDDEDGLGYKTRETWFKVPSGFMWKNGSQIFIDAPAADIKITRVKY